MPPLIDIDKIFRSFQRFNVREFVNNFYPLRSEKLVYIINFVR